MSTSIRIIVSVTNVTYGDGARIAHPKASGNSTHARESAHATHKSTSICAAAMSNIGEGALKFMEVNSTDSIGTNQWVAASAARAKPASEFEPWPGGLRGDSGQTSKVAVAAGGALPVNFTTGIHFTCSTV